MDLSEMDFHLLKYVGFWLETFPDTEEVIFIHNVKHYFPDELEELIQSLDKPLAELIEQELRTQIESLPGPPEVNTRILITENDSSAHAISNIAKEEKADMIFVGKKVNFKGAGIISSKLLRLVEKPVLFIPETAHHSISRILLPTDFSTHSAKALEYGIHFHKEINADLYDQHVYHVPVRYFPYIPVSEVKDSMLENAKKSHKKFLQKSKVDDKISIISEFTQGKNKSVVENIHYYALRKGVDFIIIGAKGKTMFIGSKAEGLISQDMNIPLLVVKK